MARKRLNDTVGLTQMNSTGGVEHSISVRKIDNGFLTRRNSYNARTGDSFCEETFSRSEPVVKPQVVQRGIVGDSGPKTLSRAADYLRGGDAQVGGTAEGRYSRGW